jgi:replicative DNA helicase
MTEFEKKARVPPNSKESEMMVLGCMLTSVNALNIGADGLEDLDFYYTEHQIIYSALRGAYRADKPADIHLIGEELKRQGKLENVGGISYLTTLAQYAGTSAFMEEYISLVREKSVLRQMISAAQKIEKTALEEPPDVLAALDQAQAQFFSISQENQTNSGVTIKDLLSGLKAESKLPYLKELQSRQQNYQEKGPDDTRITGIPTHYVDLDKMVNGFNPSNLMILAARPAMGKTALALNLAENICFKNKIPVGIFSLEMSATQLLHRVICSQSEVESDKIQTGSLNGSEYQRIVAAANSMQKQVMIIDDQPGLKITDLRARARRMREAYNVGFIVIDYLQLISGSGNHRNAENRQMEISEISRMLKNLARELNIPILCLAQLSRKVEERQGHRPMMSDLRESGCLAADTLIKDADTGQLYTIKELAERKNPSPIRVFAMDENLKIGPHTMTKVFSSGKKTLFELKTKSGRCIKATANHPFYKLEGWTRLDQMKVGDRIAIPRSLNTSPQKSTLEKNELIFLGHLLGDGCILPNQPYHYTSADPENLSIVTEVSKELCGSALFKSGISRNRLSTLSHFLKDESLSLLAESDLFWDEISSITELGIEEVFDATVPGVHNFVANDFIVHNSLEQDSDIVMFLLRREYYDPYDKPGLAELIVAKNRHGGVGSVNLAFRKEIAQFANYTAIGGQPDVAKSNKEAFSAFSPNDN